MSGLVETEPIDGIIKGITERGGIVVDPSTAIIDPVAGVKKAAEIGLDLIVIGVHITGVSKEEALTLLQNVDITTSCASKNVRDLAKPLAQVGTAVPLFALTQKGTELVIERAKEVHSSILIDTMPLPILPENKQLRELQ